MLLMLIELRGYVWFNYIRKLCQYDALPIGAATHPGEMVMPNVPDRRVCRGARR